MRSSSRLNIGPPFALLLLTAVLMAACAGDDRLSITASTPSLAPNHPLGDRAAANAWMSDPRSTVVYCVEEHCLRQDHYCDPKVSAP